MHISLATHVCVCRTVQMKRQEHLCWPGNIYVGTRFCPSFGRGQKCDWWRWRRPWTASPAWKAYYCETIFGARADDLRTSNANRRSMTRTVRTLNCRASTDGEASLGLNSKKKVIAFSRIDLNVQPECEWTSLSIYYFAESTNTVPNYKMYLAGHWAQMRTNVTTFATRWKYNSEWSLFP